VVAVANLERKQVHGRASNNSSSSTQTNTLPAHLLNLWPHGYRARRTQ
jgi:hypothetical protein